MTRKIVPEAPSPESSLEGILDFLGLNHNRTHILHAFHLLDALCLDRESTVAGLGCNGLETLMILSRMGFENIIVADYDGEAPGRASYIY